ncbi:MAG: hypothetical protein WBO95_06925, partial [Candidatus Dechloromonas phosphoritropha]
STPCMFVAYRSARAIANMIASSVIRQPSIVIPVWFRLVRLRISVGSRPVRVKWFIAGPGGQAFQYPLWPRSIRVYRCVAGSFLSGAAIQMTGLS